MKYLQRSNETHTFKVHYTCQLLLNVYAKVFTQIYNNCAYYANVRGHRKHQKETGGNSYYKDHSIPSNCMSVLNLVLMYNKRTVIILSTYNGLYHHL